MDMDRVSNLWQRIFQDKAVREENQEGEEEDAEQLQEEGDLE